LFDEPRLLAEPRSVLLAGREVSFLLKRSLNRRRAVLTVDERGLTVSVPWRTSDRYIARFLHDSAAWVLRKLEAWESRKPPQRRWEDGEAIDYLGRQLCLCVTQDPHGLVQLLEGAILRVGLPAGHRANDVHAAVIKWYRRHAQQYFRDRVEHYSARLGIQPPRVFLSNAQSRWGSCNANGQVRLSWRLMQAPATVIDYVVCHELAHLKEMNHSARFWRIVERLCPEYAGARAELNAMGQHYMAL
jgi:predicted metal-dependent hydrolase